MNIELPYVLYTGDAKDFKQAKTAFGVYEWTSDIVCQLTSEAYPSHLYFPNTMVVEDFEQAKSAGAKTLLIGYSPYEKNLPESFKNVVLDAMSAGLNVASGLHGKLNDNILFSDFAAKCGVKIYDFRHRDTDYPKGNGLKRSGLRLLTVGTDCACGKKFTALSLHRSMQENGYKSTFRSTGQTGFLISRSGINNDTIQADFLSGAAEWLSPANDSEHWDFIEGQGALTHPSFCGGSLSLIRGSQPDFIVMSHDPTRTTQRGVTTPMPSLAKEIELNLIMGRLSNPNLKLGAISVFAPGKTHKEMKYTYSCYREQFNVPVFDPNVGGSDYELFLETLMDMSDKAK